MSIPEAGGLSSLRTLLSAILCLALPSAVPAAEEVRIMVAANFAPTLERIVAEFTAVTGQRVLISSGSTGRHYAQIRNGAAFDIFLAADAERPGLLEAQGFGVPGSRFSYATGRLALWAPGEARIPDPAGLLRAGRFGHLAIANPRLAPYGSAAQQVLEAWSLWQPLQPKLVRGENVGQAFHYVVSGNAELGLVALSQVLAQDPTRRGAYSVLSETLHDPIDQQALLLRPGRAAASFLDYLRGDAAARQLRASGYGVPAHP